MAESFKVLLVDDEEVFREGLVKLLESQSHIELIFQSGSGREAIEKNREKKPDVVLVSNQIQDADISEIIEEIIRSSPGVKVIMITRPGESESPLNVLKTGVKACIDKNITAADLIKTLELVASGRIIIGPAFAQEFVADIRKAEEIDSNGDTGDKSSLSKREIEIARLIAEGASNKELAEKLFIAENTVKVHVKNILKKLELRNRQQLAAYTVLQNWMVPDEEDKEE